MYRHFKELSRRCEPHLYLYCISGQTIKFCPGRIQLLFDTSIYFLLIFLIYNHLSVITSMSSTKTAHYSTLQCVSEVLTAILLDHDLQLQEFIPSKLVDSNTSSEVLGLYLPFCNFHPQSRGFI